MSLYRCSLQVVGEELSVLPGMDAFAAIASIELLAKPGGGLLSALQRRTSTGTPSAKGGGKGAFSSFPWGAADADVVVFDGGSSTDTLRLLGSPERGRWARTPSPPALGCAAGALCLAQCTVQSQRAAFCPVATWHTAHTGGGGGDIPLAHQGPLPLRDSLCSRLWSPASHNQGLSPSPLHSILLLSWLTDACAGGTCAASGQLRRRQMRGEWPYPLSHGPSSPL